MGMTIAAAVEATLEAPVAESPIVAPPLNAAADALVAGDLPPLAVPRAHAVAYLRQQYDKGVAIYRLRIHHVEDLDDCRGKKLGWTIETTDLLTRLFGCTAVADFCNDFVGKIHPEYADFGNFVQQFYNEMTHRLKRLREIQNRLDMTRGEGRLMKQTNEMLTAKRETAEVANPRAASASPAPAAPSLREVVLLALDAKAEEGQQVAQFLEQLGVPVAATSDATSETAGSSHRFALLPTLPAASDAAAIFQLGLTAGKLGPERICVLNANANDAGLSSAFGLTHLTYDAGGGWRLDLARLLKRAGFTIDLNRLCA